MDSNAGIAMAIILVVYAVLFLVLIGVYILSSYPIHKLAKNRGVENPWLAWIPVGNLWVLGKLANKDLSVLGILRIGKDTVPLVMVLLPFVSMFSSILAIIPILGWLAVIALVVVMYAAFITLYKNIFMDYYDNTTAWILGALTYVTGIVGIVVFWMIKDKPVVYSHPQSEGYGPGYGKGIAFLLGKSQNGSQNDQPYNQGYQNNQGYQGGQGYGYNPNQQSHQGTGYGQPQGMNNNGYNNSDMNGYGQQNQGPIRPQVNPSVNIQKQRPNQGQPHGAGYDAVRVQRNPEVNIQKQKPNYQGQLHGNYRPRANGPVNNGPQQNARNNEHNMNNQTNFDDNGYH